MELKQTYSANKSEDCGICFDVLNAADTNEIIFSLTGCNHVYHRSCLTEFFKMQIETANFPLTCPNHECRHTADGQDIKFLLTKDAFERFTRFEWKQRRANATDAIDCLNPDCYFFVEAETPRQTELNC